MRKIYSGRAGLKTQFLFSILTVLISSLVCYGLSSYMGYRVVALVLLLAVSLVAVLFDILPVLLAAGLSAFVWDFFFIPPLYTIHVDTTEDLILLIMYFVIALISAVLTYKIRQMEKVARKKEEKEKTIRLYNTLLHSLSHELRTPIAAIIGAVDNLRDEQAGFSGEDRKLLMDEIAQASLRLNLQVENLLNMSRIESGTWSPKPDWCDMAEIVYDTVRRCEEEKDGQLVQVEVQPGIPLIRTDKVMVEQILANLVGNAFRYSGKGTVIKIRAGYEPGFLTLLVEDNGPGIPDQDLPFVFDKFYRVSRPGKGGTGLGLSIVKGFTEALSGQAEIKSVPAGGVAVMIRLPAAALPQKMAE